MSSHKIIGGGIAGGILWIVRNFIATIIEFAIKEIWSSIRIPIEMIGACYQWYSMIGELQHKILILQWGWGIMQNFTIGLSIKQGIFQSIIPFSNLIWLLFGGAIIWFALTKLILPIIAETI